MVLEAIATINQAVNNFVWGIPAMVCIIGVGLLLSVRTGFLQIRKFPYAIKTTIGRMFHKKDASDGAMTPFQAVCTALVRAGAAVINEADSVTAISRPLHGFEFDATNCPDLFPALAALAAAADGVSTIRGTSRLLHKESNRAEAIREEYAKVGIEVDISEEDVMRIRGGKIRPARVSSHDDHRMAMSMAVSALRCDGQITIENAECVAKSYPGFFEDLEKIRV